MSNSALATYTTLSPHRRKRTGKIDRITIHHAAMVGSAKDIGNAFQHERVASANYGVGNDGGIGLYVPEEYRAITSSSTANDNRAVTIEVSNSATPKDGHPEWPVSDAAYESLIALCADVCLRNGIERLVYTGDTKGNLTRHNMFTATLCPGPYLQERFPAIAEAVNERLEEMRMTRYDKIADMPEWARETVAALCDEQIIRGGGGAVDENGRPADLNMTEDMLRMLVWNARAGLYRRG